MAWVSTVPTRLLEEWLFYSQFSGGDHYNNAVIQLDIALLSSEILLRCLCFVEPRRQDGCILIQGENGELDLPLEELNAAQCNKREKSGILQGGVEYASRSALCPH